MPRVDRGGAFVPVIAIGGNLPGQKKEPITLFSNRQNSFYLKNDKNCSKLGKSIFKKGLFSKSEQQIAEEILNDLNIEKQESANLIENLSPSTKKFLIVFSTIASAILSWVITPSTDKVVSFLFSFIMGSVVYLILQKKLLPI